MVEAPIVATAVRSTPPSRALAAVGGLARSVALALALAACAPAAAADGEVYPPLPAGQQTYGGPFRLTDHDGRPFTERDLRGHWSLLYFGYTGCADVCPTALYRIARAMRALEDDGTAVQMVFVDLDTALGSREELKRYVTYFHPRMRGLTGSAQAVADAAAAWRVHWFRAGDGADARIEHSGAIFLVAPDGAPVTFLPHGAEAEDIAATVRHHARPAP